MDINDSVRSTLSHKRDTDPDILRVVRDALDKLRFGSIHLTVHEGKLVQIDVTEKTRLSA